MVAYSIGQTPLKRVAWETNNHFIVKNVPCNVSSTKFKNSTCILKQISKGFKIHIQANSPTKSCHDSPNTKCENFEKTTIKHQHAPHYTYSTHCPQWDH